MLLLAARTGAAETAQSKARLAAFQPPPAAKTPDGLSGLHWTFRDIEINSLLARLKRFGVEVPVPVSGQVTVRLSAGVTSWRSILRTSAYQVEGQIESDKLTVAGFDLHQFAAQMIYNDGALQLTSVRFAVPRPGGGQGTVSGSARVQVRPRGDLTANVSIERIPLSELAELAPQFAGMIAGDAGGHVSAQVPIEKLRELSAWQGQAHLTLEQVALPRLPPAELVADVRLAAGQATLSNLTVELERLRLTGSGALALAAPFEFSSQLRLNAPDLAWLANFDPQLQLPLTVGGQLSATAAVTGKIQSREFRARGTLAGRGLKAGPLGIERLHVPYDLSAQLLQLNPIQVSLYGGHVGASLKLPFDSHDVAEFGLQWRGLDVGALAADVISGLATRAGDQVAPGLVPGGADVDRDGRADAARDQPATRAGATAPDETIAEAGWQGQSSGSLQLRAPLDRLRDLDAWTGQGQFRLQNGAAYGMT
ncbi:MAG TPA: hypothetical protein VFW87_24640, partial [Pirellulales bacterium]|nr:hypothetical protein [Pirellulales bacterium]